MTHAQQKRHEKLRNAVMNAHDKWSRNTNKEMDEKLHNVWSRAMEKCEVFEEKYL